VRGFYYDPKSLGDLISSSTRGLSPLPVHESNRITIVSTGFLGENPAIIFLRFIVAVLDS
jgi:hypothetical protein